MATPIAVLIVEDSESDAQLLIRLLEKADYTVTFEVVETAAHAFHAGTANQKAALPFVRYNRSFRSFSVVRFLL